jgi:hypothetical protein
MTIRFTWLALGISLVGCGSGSANGVSATGTDGGGGGADATTGDAAGDDGSSAGSSDAGKDGASNASADANPDGAGSMLPPACASGAFCWVSPLPTGEILRGVWAVGPNEVWTVGDLGAVERYDGHAWNLVPTGTTSNLSGVWASGPSDAWVVGTGGTALHFDGSGWTAAAVGTAYDLNAVWSDGTDVWIAGDQGTLIRCSGGSCNQDVPTYPAGTRPPDGGVALGPVDSGTPENLTALWGTSASDLWAFGSLTIHRDASGWHPAPTFALGGGVVRGVAGSSSTNICLISSFSLYLTQWDGTGWQPRCDVSGMGGYGAVATSGPKDAWAATGDALVHWDGTSCTTIPWSPDLTPFAMAAVGPGDLWGVGLYGLRVHRTPSMAAGSPPPLVSPEGKGAVFVAENDYWLLDRVGATHWDGTQYTATPPLPGLADAGYGMIAAIAAGWASATSHGLWVTGVTGAGPFTAHWDGSSWSMYPNIGGQVIGGTSSSDVWTVEPTGNADRATNLFHWDGSTWTTATVQGYAIDLQGFWGTSPTDFWGCGSGVFHYDGHQWTLDPSQAVQSVGGFLSVWGSSASDVWAVGRMQMAHYDGHAWATVSAPPAALVQQSVWGSSPTDVWTSSGTTLWHYDGTSWGTIPSNIDHGIVGGWSSPSGHAWIYGMGGTVLERQ